MTYGFCVYHEIECDYDGQCVECPHNTEEDTDWFKQKEKEALDMVISDISENMCFAGMTNGETLLAIYPNTEVEICEQYNTVRVWFAIDKDHHFKDISFGLDWWNAPYQKGGECE